MLGAILTGVLAQKALNSGGADGLIAGNPKQVGLQIAGVLAAGLYSAVITFVLLKVVNALVGLRVTTDEEREGLDSTQHGESGYVM
jgi:Amt family ammonium transporter